MCKNVRPYEQRHSFQINQNLNVVIFQLSKKLPDREGDGQAGIVRALGGVCLDKRSNFI